jgi:glycosyltransferase 2 family protein
VNADEAQTQRRHTLRASWRWLAAGLAIGGVAVWLVLVHTDLEGVAGVLAGGVDWVLLGSALLAYSLFFVLKAVRWQLMLRPLAALPLGGLFAYVLVGYAGNVLLPLQTGDLARGYLLAKRHDLSAAAVLPGIVVEKLFDLFALLALLIWALGNLKISSPLMDGIAQTLAVALAAAGVLLAFVLARPRAVLALADRALAWGPAAVAARLRPLAVPALAGLATLSQGRPLAMVLAVSLLAWIAMLAALWLSVVALQIELPLAVAVVILVLSAVGLMLPTSPGFVGTLQAAFVLGMVPFGFNQEAAVAASLVYQALTTVLPLLAVGLGWVALRARRRQNASAAASGRSVP